jgi:hypothetical protein
MREILYMLLYIACAAVLTALPALMLFVLFREQPDEPGSVRKPALVTGVEAQTSPFDETLSREDPQPGRQPVWIIPTPKYEYDPPAIPTDARASEAFGSGTAQNGSSQRSTMSTRQEREAIPPRRSVGSGSSEVSRDIEGSKVFDTSPLTPD